jgi:hypothetical protein
LTKESNGDSAEVAKNGRFLRLLYPEMVNKNIDLSGLSSIEVEIEYDAFLKPGG